MNYLQLWCEWDYGQETMLFTSEEQGRKWLEKKMRRYDGNDVFEENWPLGIEQVFDEEHLAGFTIVTVYED